MTSRPSSFRRWLRASALVAVACVGSALLFHNSETSAWDTEGYDAQHDVSHPDDGGTYSHGSSGWLRDSNTWLRNGWHPIDSTDETCEQVLAAHGSTRNGLAVDIPNNFRVRDCIDYYKCDGRTAVYTGDSEWLENHRHPTTDGSYGNGSTLAHQYTYRVSLDGVVQSHGVTADDLTCGGTLPLVPPVVPPQVPPVTPPPLCVTFPGEFQRMDVEFVGDVVETSSGLQRRQLRVSWGDLSAGDERGCTPVVSHVRFGSYRAVGAEAVTPGLVSTTLRRTRYLAGHSLLFGTDEPKPVNHADRRPDQQVYDSGVLRADYRVASSPHTGWEHEMTRECVDGGDCVDISHQGRFFRIDVYANNWWRNGHGWGPETDFYTQVLCPANSPLGGLAFSGLIYPGIVDGQPFGTVPDQNWVTQCRRNCGLDFIPDVTINTPDGYEGVYSVDDDPDLAAFHGRTWTLFRNVTFTPDDLTACEVVIQDFWVEHPDTGSNTYTAGPTLNCSCTYTVTYPTTSAHGNLRLDPNAAGHDTTVSVDDPATQATYEEAFFSPQVTINIPDGHVGGRSPGLANMSPPNEWAFFRPVTFERASGPADCEIRPAQGTLRWWFYARSARPLNNVRAQTVPRVTLQLDRRCVYDVSYPTNNSTFGTERTITLVTPVNDPNTAAREDQVAADDPNTTWDERATEATYDDACPLPSSMSAWPVRTARRIGLPTLLGGTPTQQWEWEWDDTPPAAFNWNSDTDDCARAFRVDNLGLRGVGSQLTSAAANPPQPNKWLPLNIDNDDQHINADTTADHIEHRRNVVSAGARTWTDQASSIIINPRSANTTHGPHAEWNITRAELDIAA